MASGTIVLEGDTRRLLKKLQHLADLPKKNINAALGEAMRTSTMERFKQEKDPEGKRWVRSIRAQREGGVTLTKSSRLKTSIKSQGSAEGFAVGTNTIYARTHQLGEDGRKITIKAKTSRGLTFKIGDKWIRKKQVTVKIKIPKRPFLGLSDEDQKEIRATIEDALREE